MLDDFWVATCQENLHLWLGSFGKIPRLTKKLRFYLEVGVVVIVLKYPQ